MTPSHPLPLSVVSVTDAAVYTKFRVPHPFPPAGSSLHSSSAWAYWAAPHANPSWAADKTLTLTLPSAALPSLEHAVSPCPPAGSAAGVPTQCDAVPPWCWNWAHCNSTPAGSSTASTAAGVAVAVAVAGAVSSPDWRHTQRQAELRTGRQIMARTVKNDSLVWLHKLTQRHVLLTSMTHSMLMPMSMPSVVIDKLRSTESYARYGCSSSHKLVSSTAVGQLNNRLQLPPSTRFAVSHNALRISSSGASLASPEPSPMHLHKFLTWSVDLTVDHLRPSSSQIVTVS